MASGDWLSLNLEIAGETLLLFLMSLLFCLLVCTKFEKNNVEHLDVTRQRGGREDSAPDASWRCRYQTTFEMKTDNMSLVI
eukprot:768695-Hanusia_phi.AAC.6